MAGMRVVRRETNFPQANWRIGAIPAAVFLVVVLALVVHGGIRQKDDDLFALLWIGSIPVALVFAWLANRRVIKPRVQSVEAEDVSEDTQARVNAAFERRRASKSP